MKTITDKSQHTGTFRVSADREVMGNLSLDGLRTSLHVWDKEFFHIKESTEKTFTGVLNDLRKVSLINCWTNGPGFRTREGDSLNYYDIHPQYVIFGDQHIANTDKTITGVSFLVDDAATLFYDYESFGHVRNPLPIMQKIIETDNSYHKASTGDHPIIFYYTGKMEIFSSETIVGKISAHHSPSYSMGGPSGITIDNKIPVNIEFSQPIAFGEVVDRMWRVLRFLELAVGRVQNLLEFTLSVEAGREIPEFLEVYPCRYPKHARSEGAFEQPHPGDILINAIKDPNGFSDVLAAWLERSSDSRWQDARWRFFRFFEKQQNYDWNRLISAANMFDILPDMPSLKAETLPEDLSDAKEECREKFKSLPSSEYRSSILNALGRVGKPALKQKINARSKFLTEKIGDQLPDLYKVIREAVDCRNYHVHGNNDPKIDYNNNFDVVWFLTNTLEFVFAASDLVEAGWNIKGFCETGSHMGHPLGRYLYGYLSNLEKLKSLL